VLALFVVGCGGFASDCLNCLRVWLIAGGEWQYYILVGCWRGFWRYRGVVLYVPVWLASLVFSGDVGANGITCVVLPLRCCRLRIWIRRFYIRGVGFRGPVLDNFVVPDV